MRRPSRPTTDLSRKSWSNSEGEEKHLVLNKTNSVTLSLAFGAETDNWRGKEVELYVDPNVEYMGRKVGGIRVRALQKPSAANDGA